MNGSPSRFRFLVTVCLLFLLGCASAPSGIRRFKMHVFVDGFYRLTGRELESAGMDLQNIDLSTIRVMHANQEVAIRTRGDGRDLVLDFYGQASDSPFSASNVYWLTFGGEKGKRIAARALAPSEQAPTSSYRANVRLTQPSLFIPQAGELSDSWFWQALTAPMTTSIPLPLTAALPAQAQVRVNVFGASHDAANPDHHTRLLFNDVPIADEQWDGQGKHVVDALVPAGLVRPEGNSLQLAAPGDTRAAADVVLLSSIEITYTRRFVAQEGMLAFQADGGAFRLEGLRDEPFDLFDVTDPANPVIVRNADADERAIDHSALDPTTRQWIAVGASGYKTVTQVIPMHAENLADKDRDADYVIITYPDFARSLRPLVEWRSKRGLRVSVVTTSEIYDAYNDGAESPLAVRTFLASIHPRFVLLVGKASYDYRDYLNGPNRNLVPTFLLETLSLSQVASDNWFAAASPSDPRPTFAIGRIPAKTTEQVALAVSKIIAYESASRTLDWRKRAIFVADDKEASFAAMSDQLAAKIPVGMGADKIYLASQKGDVNSTRAEMIARWNGGAALLSYVGHGSVDTWAEGPLFSSDDVDQLRNGDRLPVLFTPTCLDGFFYHPEKDSLAEVLLFKKDGGIIAGVVPTGFSITEAQAALMSALFSELFESSAPTLGQSLLRAKQKLPVDPPEMREIVQTFVLLGDPALEIGN